MRLPVFLRNGCAGGRRPLVFSVALASGAALLHFGIVSSDVFEVIGLAAALATSFPADRRARRRGRSDDRAS